MKRNNAWPAGASLAAAWLAAAQPAPLMAQTPARTDTLKVGGYLEAGITFNPADPPNRRNNFGRLFDDRANRPLLNQLAILAERPIDAKSADVDLGFKLHAFYGSDARYTHFLGLFNNATSDANQFDIVEANVSAHLPYLTEGGIDVKAGLYPTPIGYEVIDPKGNVLYSHSYIFNFGIPLKHLGGLATVHVNDMIDLWGGVDSGINTTLGDGDNNSSPGFIAGVGRNFLDGKYTLLALTHVGAENPNNNHDIRYTNDVVFTAKMSDALTLVTEANYFHDEVPGPSTTETNGAGIAQYGVYTLSDSLSLIGRAEVYVDMSGNVIGSFPGNKDFVNFEKGLATSSDVRFTGRHTTIGALTLGLNWKPPIVGLGEGTVLRPEIRYDRSLGDSSPFEAQRNADGVLVGTSKGQFTIGGDIVIPF